jgi:hypothetical protein
MESPKMDYDREKHRHRSASKPIRPGEVKARWKWQRQQPPKTPETRKERRDRLLRYQATRRREEITCLEQALARTAGQLVQLQLGAGDKSARDLYTQVWRGMLSDYVKAGLDLTKFPRTIIVDKLAKHFGIDPRTVERAIAEERKRREKQRRPELA